MKEEWRRQSKHEEVLKGRILKLIDKYGNSAECTNKKALTLMRVIARVISNRCLGFELPLTPTPQFFWDDSFLSPSK